MGEIPKAVDISLNPTEVGQETNAEQYAADRDARLAGVPQEGVASVTPEQEMARAMEAARLEEIKSFAENNGYFGFEGEARDTVLKMLKNYDEELQNVDDRVEEFPVSDLQAMLEENIVAEEEKSLIRRYEKERDRLIERKVPGREMRDFILIIYFLWGGCLGWCCHKENSFSQRGIESCKDSYLGEKYFPLDYEKDLHRLRRGI